VRRALLFVAFTLIMARPAAAAEPPTSASTISTPATPPGISIASSDDVVEIVGAERHGAPQNDRRDHSVRRN
jgi:hypothetical protein